MDPPAWNIAQETHENALLMDVYIANTVCININEPRIYQK